MLVDFIGILVIGLMGFGIDWVWSWCEEQMEKIREFDASPDEDLVS
tara:strand:+ start:130 stop:267 length:138 start_codon:yes stop_codon:yes gene_type:complete